MKLNKRGMMDDMADFLFMVAVGVFLLLFISLSINGSIQGKEKQTLQELSKTMKVQDRLVQERGQFVQGQQTNMEKLHQDIRYILKLGYIPGSQDDPLVGGKIQ